MDGQDQTPERQIIPVSKAGTPHDLGVHIYEELKNRPRGIVAELVAIGPIAVNNAVRGLIEANSRLARQGLYLYAIPASKQAKRHEDSARNQSYSDTITTVFVLVLQDMD